MSGDELVRLYTDLVVISELHRNSPEMLKAAADSVFKAHRADSTLLHHTMRYYARHPGELAPIYEESILNLESRLKAIQEADSIATASP